MNRQEFKEKLERHLSAGTTPLSTEEEIMYIQHYADIPIEKEVAPMIQELSELTIELTNMARHRKEDRIGVIEETADVWNIIRQVCARYGISEIELFTAASIKLAQYPIDTKE